MGLWFCSICFTANGHFLGYFPGFYTFDKRNHRHSTFDVFDKNTNQINRKIIFHYILHISTLHSVLGTKPTWALTLSLPTVGALALSFPWLNPFKSTSLSGWTFKTPAWYWLICISCAVNHSFFLWAFWCWDSGKSWQRDQRGEVASNCNYRTHHCHKINIGLGRPLLPSHPFLSSLFFFSSPPPLFYSSLNLVLPKVSSCEMGVIKCNAYWTGKKGLHFPKSYSLTKMPGLSMCVLIHPGHFNS